jgi:putative aminopeptidase FrvX
MRKESMNFFENLIALPSPSGFEENASKLFKNYIGNFCDEVRVDTLGNVMGVIRGKSKNAFNVMISGHIDEIGLMVKYVNEKGFIYFAAIGGVDVRLLLGLRVIIHTAKGKVKGVIGQKPIHLMEAAEKEKVSKIHDLFIDIGAKNKKETMKWVSIGDPVTVDWGLDRLMNDFLVGRGFDDRMGAFCVAELLRALSGVKDKLSVNIYGVASVQEEIGLRGATVSSYSIDPKVGIAVDVGFATDFPSVDAKIAGESELGGGPIITRGPNINPHIFDLLVKTAKKNKIPYQLEGSPRGTGTDANVMQMTKGGVATGLVSVPLRYMHTPVEVLAEKDLDSTIKLLKETVLQLKPGMDFKPF